jgi:hypothetical protein
MFTHLSEIALTENRFLSTNAAWTIPLIHPIQIIHQEV